MEIEDLNSCVDETNHKYSLQYFSRGGQGAIFKTQYSKVIVKIETSNDQPLPANEESRKKFLALRLLPIPRKLNVTVPMTLLADFSGYTMTLMEDMESFERAFSRESDAKIENPWLESVAESNPELALIFYNLILRGGLRRFWLAYFKAAEILAQLHAAGLVYCDFSANNVFISSDQNFCHVWLIDADNLDFQKNTRDKSVYTPTVGAPELHNGNNGCTFYADCYAFASTMFQQLTERHPFQGEIYENAEVELEDANACSYRGYFNEPGDLPWIFNSDDDSNSWSSVEIFRQELIPQNILELFDRNFYAGLFQLQLRPQMNEWCFELARALDSVIRCPYCQMERYSSPEKCSWCDEPHPVVVMKSQFWTFSHEIKNGGEIPVPMRIVHGFRANEIDAAAFTVALRNGKIIIKKIGDKFTSEFSDASTPRKKSAGFETYRSELEIFCTDSKGGIHSLIEVKIFNGT